MPKYRKRLTRKKSKREFSRKSGVHKKNRPTRNTRGGGRL